ncbi:MAG TPA: DUF488 domain-containing protein [Rubricoccaceae bacterium]|jgi:uncharacterized protein (DUF488 family)
MSDPFPLATIGYEGATLDAVVRAVQAAGVQTLVDVRAVARSRRPGFAKSRLAAGMAEGGIGYVHLRGLGTPAEGRAASKAGDHAGMQRVFREHLATPEAQTDLHALADRVGAGERVALLCFEADAAHCHRRLVAEALGLLVPIAVSDLTPAAG